MNLLWSKTTGWAVERRRAAVGGGQWLKKSESMGWARRARVVTEEIRVSEPGAAGPGSDWKNPSQWAGRGGPSSDWRNPSQWTGRGGPGQWLKSAGRHLLRVSGPGSDWSRRVAIYSESAGRAVTEVGGQCSDWNQEMKPAGHICRRFSKTYPLHFLYTYGTLESVQNLEQMDFKVMFIKKRFLKSFQISVW